MFKTVFWKVVFWAEEVGRDDEIIDEYLIDDESMLPKVGDRAREHKREVDLIDPRFPDQPTHYRDSDWVVSRIEKTETAVNCYCTYDPINAEWKRCPQLQVTLDSFGGDEAAYKAWYESAAAS